MISRYLHADLLRDIEQKMVFLGGARQCGKTTVAEQIKNATGDEGLVLNWDNDADRKVLLKQAWKDSDRILVFDELHKYHRWKNWLKGIYDKQKHLHRILVTGSARLDVYKRGGDSLLGRYHYWRLHPFTVDETPAALTPEESFRRLLSVGGFPEPFLSGDPIEAKRWRRERVDKIIREDIRDLERVREIRAMELFLQMLRERVGAEIVLSNIAEDLQVSPKTLTHWLEILEKMYVVFVVRPWSKSLPRALQKAPKVYFLDTGDVDGDEGARFENLVATHLLKRCHYETDRTGTEVNLHYVRDREKREIDFLITRDRKVEELIEAKWNDGEPSPHLRYFGERIPHRRCVQIVGHLARRIDLHPNKGPCVSIIPFLEEFKEPISQWLARRYKGILK